MRKFTADFETSTPNWLEYDKVARVWAYSICEINNTSNFIYGNNIEDFINFCQGKENYLIYFHNLKFDIQYIFSYLFNNGYELILDKKLRRDKTFTCLISEMGDFYSLEIYFKVGKKRCNKVTIYDSLKIINMSVDEIAKRFNLPIRKLTLDYDMYRPVGYALTSSEIDYIKNDVEIMARALEIMFNEGLTKMTIGANAISYYRNMNESFNSYFPEIPFEIDKDIRQAYRGGFTYVNPINQNKLIDDGIVLDVNSLYPWVLHECDLPFGVPIYFDGEYKDSFLYPLYIQMLSCSFELKEGMIPTIQIKGDKFYQENEYLESSNGDIITLCLTNIDLELFKDHYNISNEIYHGGYKFKSSNSMFKEYIDIWSNKKIEAKQNKNKAMYQISKLMLNSLYGKFAKNPIIISKYPYMDSEGIVKYYLSDPVIGKGLYLPVGVFTTAYARNKTIRTSQKIRDYTKEYLGEDYYLYSDTDSIHMKRISEAVLKQFVDIDDYRLGAWKLESVFNKAKFIRQKCYIENQEIDEEEYINAINNPEFDDLEKSLYTKNGSKYYRLSSTIAGLPKKLGKYVNFNNFNIGFGIMANETEKEHKLRYNHVKGGVILTDTDFTLK